MKIFILWLALEIKSFLVIKYNGYKTLGNTIYLIDNDHELLLFRICTILIQLPGLRIYKVSGVFIH